MLEERQLEGGEEGNEPGKAAVAAVLGWRASIVSSFNPYQGTYVGEERRSRRELSISLFAMAVVVAKEVSFIAVPVL